MSDGGGYVKRPLLLTGAAFFVTVWLLTSFGLRVFAVAAVIFLSLSGFVLILLHRKRAVIILLVFLSVSTALGCFLKIENEFSALSASLQGHNRQINACIYSAQDYRFGSSCIVKLETVDGVKAD